MELDAEALFKLSEKYLNVSITDRNQYYNMIFEILQDKDGDKAATAQEILKFIIDLFEQRKLDMAAGSANPNATKSKGLFKRVGAEQGSVFSKEDDCIQMKSGVNTDSGIIILKR